MHIIPNQGICDSHMHVCNGRVYMFATHDRSPSNDNYRMDDWKVFSTDDLVNWKLEYTLRPEDIFLGKCKECYATDSAERNGKYYLYFSHQQKCTGVAVADRPAGPYSDALGKPLLPQGLTDTPSYDPCVFDFHNQTYFAYGVPANHGQGETDHYYRATKIIYAHYKSNGEIVTDEFIEDVGVGQYDASWKRIKGEWYFAASDGVYKQENGSGFEMRGITDGALLGSCTCEPECAIQHGDTREFPISLTDTSDTHSLCFVFRGEGEDLFTFEDFRFEQIKP